MSAQDGPTAAGASGAGGVAESMVLEKPQDVEGLGPRSVQLHDLSLGLIQVLRRSRPNALPDQPIHLSLGDHDELNAHFRQCSDQDVEVHLAPRFQ